MDFSKFDKMVDLDGLAKDVAEAAEKKGDFEPVPHGKYEVKINKMELTESKKGKPMVTIWFKILQGECGGRLIFMNQVVTEGFQIHIIDTFLRSLESGINVEWPGSYSAFADMLMDIHEAIDGKLEYALDYGKGKNDFDTFKIVEVFEVE